MYMAANPTPPPPQGPQPGDPLQQLPPLAASLVQGQLPPPQPLPQTGAPSQPSQTSNVYKIDPKVFERKAKIRVDGSSRMITKDILAQNIQFLTPLLGNGPFISNLMQA